MSVFSSRILAVLILACWMIPSVETLGVGLHMNLHHSLAGDLEHSQASTTPAPSASLPHHHHDEASSEQDHHHGAIAVVPALRSNLGLPMVLAAPTSVAIAAADLAGLEASPRRARPVSLFTTHCSLLL